MYIRDMELIKCNHKNCKAEFLFVAARKEAATLCTDDQVASPEGAIFVPFIRGSTAGHQETASTDQPGRSPGFGRGLFSFTGR